MVSLDVLLGDVLAADLFLLVWLEVGEDCGDGLLSILFWRSGTPLCGTGEGRGGMGGRGVEGGM